MKKFLYVGIILIFFLTSIFSGCGGGNTPPNGNSPSWVEATPSAAFSGRYGHASLVYDNKI